MDIQPPAYWGDYPNIIHAVDFDGNVLVPGNPGLRVEYDWEYVEAQWTDSVRTDK